MKIKGDDVIFSTGKILSANGGRIGLGPHDQYASEGWDGVLEDDEEKHLTQEERSELANYMILLWIKYSLHEKQCK